MDNQRDVERFTIPDGVITILEPTGRDVSARADR